MADIDNRELVAERMYFQFLMTETDIDDNPIRTVSVELNCPDCTTHDEITEAFQNFLAGCGYVFRGQIIYVRDDEHIVKEEDLRIEDEEAPV